MDYDNEKMWLNQKVASLEQELAVARRCARLWKMQAKYYRRYGLYLNEAVRQTFGYKVVDSIEGDAYGTPRKE